MIQSIIWWVNIFDKNLTILSDVNINETSDSITPLSLCIYYNKVSYVDQLIELECDVRSGDDMAFCMAVITKNIDMVKKMLDMGADVNAVPNKTLLDFLGKMDTRYARTKYWHDYIFLGKLNNDPLACVGYHDNMLLFFSLPNIYDNTFDGSMYDLLSSKGVSKIHHSGVHFFNFAWLIPYTSHNFITKEILKHLVNSGSETVTNIIVYFPILLHMNQSTAVKLIYDQINQMNDDVIRNIKYGISRRILAPLLRLLYNERRKDGIISNITHNDIRSLVWCLENNFWDIEFDSDLISQLIDGLTYFYSENSYKIIRFAKEMNIDISGFITRFMIQAMKHNDINLLKTVTKDNDLDELLFKLNQHVILMLDIGPE